MPMSLTSLRKELFKVVDRIIETGIPAEIERSGHHLKIILDEEKSKLANLTPHHTIVGDPESLVDLEVADWRENENL